MLLNHFQTKHKVVSISSQPRQGGFVLILSLVMLAVLTLIGVSSMSRSNMELRATANSRQHQAAFNAAQSVLEYTSSEAGVTAVDYQTTTPNSITSYTGIANSKNVSATVSYVGCSFAIGSSLEAGKGFSYSYFNVDGRASNATGTATSLQSQGVRYPAAGC